MKRALRLARKGEWKVRPNPQVGAVIVKSGRIIAECYHRFYGGPHAEVNAISKASEDVNGATLYVNLEPCSFHGKTSPCTDLIINKGIKRVVFGMTDPNPLVSGKGMITLREAGIDVVQDVLRDECEELNAPFIKYITRNLPFVTLKIAMTLDGKTTTTTGESKWITSLESRTQVHCMRRQNMAVMIGANTAIIDDPVLSANKDKKTVYFPLRIIVDSKLRIPVSLHLFDAKHIHRTLVATTPAADPQKIEILRNLGAEVVVVPSYNGQVDLWQLMVVLGCKGVDSILIEGGATLNFSALRAGIVDKVSLFIAPKIVGGSKALPAVGGDGIPLLSEAFSFTGWKVKKVGNDLLVEVTPIKKQ
jgi:diaminohydroxyphosphoribosylaminopyrimidine deaminase/5-amino-6-(5-phosphoribosylamino)uracil reductase